MGLAFLSAYAADANQQASLFGDFDNLLNLNVSLGLKFGVLLNGASGPLKASLLPKLEQHLKECLKDMTGIEEIDGRYAEDVIIDADEDNGRLHGAFEIIGHLGDIFVRRFAAPGDEIYSLQYKAVNEANLLAKLNAEKDLSKQTMFEVLFYLQSIPVKSATGSSFDPELARVIKEGFEFINNFYLELGSKKLSQPAVANLLMLNYDNLLDVNDDSKIEELTEAKAKGVVNRDMYKSLIPENIRLLAVELLFIQ